MNRKADTLIISRIKPGEFAPVCFRPVSRTRLYKKDEISWLLLPRAYNSSEKNAEKYKYIDRVIR
jgi:hypothetical protein